MSESSAWSWGPTMLSGGSTRFRAWAPDQSRLALIAEDDDGGRALPMTAVGHGWYEIVTDAVGVNGRYRFELADGMRIPDPASRAQAGGVHDPSLLVADRGFEWRATAWRGRPWHEAVIYELHVGTFSPEGTFAGVERRLDHLAGLGMTAIELMPLAHFAGHRGWGYDGVLTYAPHPAHGTPDDLRRLVDAAHQRGLMMLLDVVYNHFGPEGCYLHALAPSFFDAARQTPWGAAIDYTRDPVRAFAIENACYWLDTFRFDGLRLDAINQVVDPSPVHVLEELAATVRARFPDRHVHLTTEDDRNITALHERTADGAVALYTAEWNDDLHHVAHVIATGESEGYYADYDTPIPRLVRTLADGYAYQGEPSAAWDGTLRGEPSAHLPPTAFVDFLQNHDQIGNRAFGERLDVLAAPACVEALTAILAMSPHIPLFYMGQEWGETRPFAFFTDFDGALADAVREGRRREFAKWEVFRDPKSREFIPDPNALSTFEGSRIDWDARNVPVHREREAFVRRLLDIRRREIVPRLAEIGGHACSKYAYDGHAVHLVWRLGDGSDLALWANLADANTAVPSELRPATAANARVILDHPAGAADGLHAGSFRPWSVVVALAKLDAEAR